MNYDYLRINKPLIEKLKVGDLIKYRNEKSVSYGFYFKSVNQYEIEVISILNSMERGDVLKVKKINII